MAEGKNLYETVIVTSAKLGEEGSAELVNKFKKQTEGYYTLINFESGPEFTAELDRRLGITDGILRNLIVKRDPRHVAALNAQKAKKAEENNIDVEAIAVEAVEAPAAESAE